MWGVANGKVEKKEEKDKAIYLTALLEELESEVRTRVCVFVVRVRSLQGDTSCVCVVRTRCTPECTPRSPLSDHTHTRGVSSRRPNARC